MFFGFDLKEILMFPFKDEEARKHLLIGCLVGLAAIIVPVLPMLVLFGYAVAIAKQVLNNETPHMIPWDDWAGLARDGIKMFGIRMIFTLPLIILMVPFILLTTLLPILMMSSPDNSNIEGFMPVFMLMFFGGVCLILPLSIPIALITPAAEMYVVEKDDFAAGFRFREWWPIFRAKLGGFAGALVIYYVSTLVFMVAIQIFSITIVLSCLTFILVPFFTIYVTLIMYVTIAQAYRDGKVKLSQKEITPPAA